MSGNRAELLFVSGPQHDDRAVLMNDIMIAGRSIRADILVKEPFVSRHQLRLALVDEGWIIESLSKSSPMRINGKTYKPGKRVLLATGDTIAIGEETELLFVDATDDPDSVLAEYRDAHPLPVPQPAALSEPPVVMDDRSRHDAEKTPGDCSEEPELAPAEQTLRERKAKLRKYAIAFAAYLALLAAGAIVLSTTRKDDRIGSTDEPPARLTARQIEEAFVSPLHRGPNEVAAERNLKEARGYFLRRTAHEPNLYRCVKAYRLYKAYRRPQQRTFEPEDERNFATARRELAKKVLDFYDNAWVAQNNGRWREAYRDLDSLLRYVPVVQSRDDPEVSSVLVDNVLEHWTYVSRQLSKK